MRRIQVLQAMDGKPTNSQRSWRLFAVICGLTLFSITTGVLRVLAQTVVPATATEQPKTETTIPVQVDAGENTIVPVAAVSDDLAPPDLPFPKDVLPAAHPVFSSSGGLHLNIAQLKASPFWFPVQTMIQTELNSSAETKAWDIHSLESIACDLQITTTQNTSRNKTAADLKKQPKAQTAKTEEAPQRDTVQMGFNRFLLKTNREIDWKAVISTHYPDSKLEQQDGKETFEVTTGLGPRPIFLQPISARELGATLGLAPDDKRKPDTTAWSAKPESLTPPNWAREWDAVRGGTLTLGFVPPKFEVYPALEQTSDTNVAGANQLKLVLENIDFIALGVNFNNETRQLSAKLRLRCKPNTDPMPLAKAVQELSQIGQVELKKLTGPENQSVMTRLMVGILKGTKVAAAKGPANVVVCTTQYTVSQNLLDLISGAPPKKKPNADEPERIISKPKPQRQ